MLEQFVRERNHAHVGHGNAGIAFSKEPIGQPHGDAFERKGKDAKESAELCLYIISDP